MYRLTGFGTFTPPPPNIATVLQTASQQSGVPLSILQAVAYQESRYKPSAVSPAGAQGLLQIMPATGTSLGLQNPFDAQQNANAGASYLASLYAQYGNWNDALVAYNEGPGNFAKSGAFPSSQSYASDILSNAGISSDSSPSVDSGSSGSDSGGVLASLVPSSGVDPLVLGGLALGFLGLVAWMA